MRNLLMLSVICAIPSVGGWQGGAQPAQAQFELAGVNSGYPSVGGTAGNVLPALGLRGQASQSSR